MPVLNVFYAHGWASGKASSL